jgi:hypothetical protein
MALQKSPKDFFLERPIREALRPINISLMRKKLKENFRRKQNIITIMP